MKVQTRGDKDNQERILETIQVLSFQMNNVFEPNHQKMLSLECCVHQDSRDWVHPGDGSHSHSKWFGLSLQLQTDIGCPKHFQNGCTVYGSSSHGFKWWEEKVGRRDSLSLYFPLSLLYSFHRKQFKAQLFAHQIPSQCFYVSPPHTPVQWNTHSKETSHPSFYRELAVWSTDSTLHWNSSWYVRVLLLHNVQRWRGGWVVVQLQLNVYYGVFLSF